jgi:hypothetical protein
MTTNKHRLALLAAGCVALTLHCAIPQASAAGLDTNAVGPSKTEIRHEGGRYRLYVNHEPFYIQGAGVEFGSQEKLKAHGGNSFRTWSTDNGRDRCEDLLDRAQRNGLYVTMGLDIRHERRGFNYDDTNAIARQFALMKSQVLKYKDHPALIIWAVGNELNLNYTNARVFDAVNDISKMIHQVDPNHLTTTTLAGFNPEVVDLVRQRAPDLDFLSFQMYSDIINLPRYLKEAKWDRPYLVTEWGATGHWECGKTSWGAPIENDSTTKADLYQTRFNKVILSDQTLCLGSYVFTWGQKQERTPTWYGMFLQSGEETAPIDVMHHIWLGQWPSNQSPRLNGIWLDGKTASQNVRLRAGQVYNAKVNVVDPDGDPVKYVWEIMEESKEQKVGGDVESVPRHVPGLVSAPEKPETTVRAPATPGAYRLFLYAYDGRGHAAHANIPFYVDSVDPSLKNAQTSN